MPTKDIGLNHFESLYPENTRFEEVEKVLNFIKSGKSVEVIGLPGTGRNNFLKLLSYNRKVRLKHLGENQKWFHFVYTDFSEVKKRSPYDVIKFILISTAYSLSERDLKKEYETVNSFLKEAIGFQDELILFQALKKSIDYLAIEKELTVIFIFDRFEQYTQDVNEQFFTNLKILRNRAKYRFSSIFSLSRPLEEALETSVLSEFQEFLSGNNVYLRIYDPTGLDFRLSYLEKVTGKKTSEKIKKEIIDLTGGHGKLARLSYEAILSEATAPKDLKKFLFEKTAIKNALLEIWASLNPSEQVFLKTGEKNEDLTYLEGIGLLKDKKVTIPLLEEYVKNISIEKDEKITFNAEKNEILKGNEPITEKLSPSEFRLLRFLILQEEKICEKDEIIQAVWKDTKTQEGVTDQALDQIIYRLRKKIEEDPNDPTHLLTVKGRGFKFVS